MTISNRRRIPPFLSFAVCATLLAVASGRGMQNPGNRKGIGKTRGEGVVLTLRFANGHWIRAVGHLGQTIRVESSDSTFLFRISRSGLEPAVDLTIIPKLLHPGRLVTPRTKTCTSTSDFAGLGLPFTVELNWVLGVGELVGDGGECCLTCSGVTVCACAVTGSCGSCCVGSCC